VETKLPSRGKAEYLWRPLRKVILFLALISGLAALAMIVITVTDIALRIGNSGITGAYDMVRIAAVISIVCSIPYVTAIKGHIAIEFFYHRFSRPGRLVLDTGFRLISLLLFALLIYHSILYGLMLKASSQVMPTLSIPVFWIPWLIASCFVLVCFTVVYHILHPGKELIKP